MPRYVNDLDFVVGFDFVVGLDFGLECWFWGWVQRKRALECTLGLTHGVKGVGTGRGEPVGQSHELSEQVILFSYRALRVGVDDQNLTAANASDDEVRSLNNDNSVSFVKDRHLALRMRSVRYEALASRIRRHAARSLRRISL
jgi:hypothetical protein